jgi:hypothetical protein
LDPAKTDKLLKTEIKIKFSSDLVIEAEAANKDGISVEIVKLEDGVGGLLGLRVPKINIINKLNIINIINTINIK